MMTPDQPDQAVPPPPLPPPRDPYFVGAEFGEDYFRSLMSSDVTLAQLIMVETLKHSGGSETSNLATRFYPELWVRYKDAQTGPNRLIVSFSSGLNVPWAIVLFSNGELDYEYQYEYFTEAPDAWNQLVYECAEGITEVEMVLRGKQKKLLSARLYTQLRTLFSAIEVFLTEAPGQGGARIDETLNSTKGKIAEINRSIRDLAVQTENRLAQQTYLMGMIPGLIIVGLLIWAVTVLGLRPISPLGLPNTLDLQYVLGGGALGALLSVLGRTTSAQLSKSLRVDTQAGTPLVVSAGAFRPILGALLALSVYVLIGSGLLPIRIPTSPSQSLFFIFAISLLAGFSERLAQDALVSTSRGIFRSSRSDKLNSNTRED
jgi:hypothetical protein